MHNQFLYSDTLFFHNKSIVIRRVQCINCINILVILHITDSHILIYILHVHIPTTTTQNHHPHHHTPSTTHHTPPHKTTTYHTPPPPVHGSYMTRKTMMHEYTGDMMTYNIATIMPEARLSKLNISFCHIALSLLCVKNRIPWFSSFYMQVIYILGCIQLVGVSHHCTRLYT